MGLSLGGSSSKTSSTGTTSSSGVSNNNYSAGQTSLQDQLMSAFASMLPGISNGNLSPNVQNMQTANANQINTNYSTVGERMNRFLAARGFGQSGQTGKAQLQTELGRQGALAQNASNASGQQLDFDKALLSDALSAAFQATGSTTNKTDNTSSSGTSSGSNWGAQASAVFGV